MGLFKSVKLFCDVASHADAVANALMLSLCVKWVFALPQIWGIIQQSKLDNLVMDIVQNEFNSLSSMPDYRVSQVLFIFQSVM